MKRIPRSDLTAEFVRSVLDYDGERGLFRWRSVKPRQITEFFPGTKSNGYFCLLLVSIYLGLKAAYDAECQRQFRRYQHEVQIAAQIGAIADPVVAEAAALVADKTPSEEL